MEPRIVILIIAFLICSLGGAFLTIFLQRLTRRRQLRLARRLGKADAPESQPEDLISPEYRPRQGVTGRIDRTFYRFMTQTGIDLEPDTAFLIAVAAGLTLCGVILLWHNDFLESAGALIAGFLLVFGYYSHRRARRSNAIREQLPDVMELLARAVRAGESLDQAVRLVGDTVAKPLGPEFHRCADQLEMGLSIDAAMRSMTLRAPLPEIRIFASALMVQRKTGGSLPAMLERLSTLIRDRLNYHRQFRAATGAGRISTLLIGLAGPLVAAYLIVFQREYFDKFTASVAGQLMLGTAILLQITGYIWIYRLLKSDY